MAINAYTGLMGSGKSYEVVSSVIVPAVRDGRRVVTNIDGVDVEAIHQYVHKKFDIEDSKLGPIVCVTTDDITKPGFFPDENDLDKPSVVRPGDLLCVDECWRFWSADVAISDEHMSFFRMHRHYADPVTGRTCDVALMIQDLGTLHRKLKNVIELTARTTKLKSLGLSKSYRIQLYEGNKTFRTTLISTINKTYDSEIFPLYSSYGSIGAKEGVIDDRQNILKNPTFLLGAVFSLVAIGFGVWYTYRLFTPAPKSPSLPAPRSLSAPPVPPSFSAPRPVYSDDWRLVGRYSVGDQNFEVVANESGRLRLESPSVFKGRGLERFGEIDGKKIVAWSGPWPAAPAAASRGLMPSAPLPAGMPARSSSPTP